MHRVTELLDTLEQVSSVMPSRDALAASARLFGATAQLLSMQADHQVDQQALAGIELMLDQVEVVLRKPA